MPKKFHNDGAKSKGDHNMEKEKTISLEKGDVESGAAIRYDYMPGGDFGEAYDEEYINVFRGNKHILVSRYFDEGDPIPRYWIVEIDLETGEKLTYQGQFRFRESLKTHVHELKAYELEKKALLESDI